DARAEKRASSGHRRHRGQCESVPRRFSEGAAMQGDFTRNGRWQTSRSPNICYRALTEARSDLSREVCQRGTVAEGADLGSLIRLDTQRCRGQRPRLQLLSTFWLLREPVAIDVRRNFRRFDLAASTPEN